MQAAYAVGRVVLLLPWLPGTATDRQTHRHHASAPIPRALAVLGGIMTAKPRCKQCKHQRGPRVSGNLGRTGVPKKAACDCQCHAQKED